MTSLEAADSSAEAAEVSVASAEAVEVQVVASEDFPVEEDPQEAEEAPVLGKNKKMTRGMTSGFLMGILKEIFKFSHSYLTSPSLYPFDFDDFVIFAQGDCIP